MLRVGAPISLGFTHVWPAVTDFLSQYSELDISLSLKHRFTDLIEEYVDLAVRIAHSEDSSLVIPCLVPMKFVMTATREYLADYRTRELPQGAGVSHVSLQPVF